MDVGMTIPARGPLATPECLEAWVKRAENLGFSHLAVPDHIVIPLRIGSKYPYAASGEFPGSATGECLDQFTLLAFLAAVTTKARLVSSVTVVPHRGAVHTAKIVATIDVLSNGRMTLGVGAGWMKEEFDAIGAPPFAERGRVTDEYLQAFKVLWTEDDPSFEGQHVRFANICFQPKPVQQPHPPIWVGGESTAAMRRAVRYGDAWYPIGINPRHPLNTRKRFAGGVDRLRRLAEMNNRDPESITLAYFATWFNESKTATFDDGQRQLLTGTDGEVAEDIRALRELGVRQLVLNFQRDTLEKSLASMQYFADEIRPLTE